MPPQPPILGASPRWAWLPSECHVCGVWPAQPLGEAVCGACLDAFVPTTPRCPTCALVQNPSGLCGECINRPPGLTQCVAAVDYAYPWDGSIARFKFQGVTAWAHLFARLMAGAPGAQALLNRCHRFVPMPLTPRRLGERGYNQAGLLAKALSRQAREHRHKPWFDALLKLQDTAAQHGLDRAARMVNLRTAFAVSPHAVADLSGQRVLLVDDIMTTGATLQAAAQALTMAGAAEVNALVFARTPRA
ncbi:MAG: hypothetical protein RJA09_141 [Pseudomonadota bacterium]